MDIQECAVVHKAKLEYNLRSKAVGSAKSGNLLLPFGAHVQKERCPGIPNRIAGYISDLSTLPPLRPRHHSAHRKDVTVHMMCLDMRACGNIHHHRAMQCFNESLLCRV